MSLFPLRLIPHTTNFNFMRVRWVSIGIAALLVIAAIGAIAFKSFNFALDFTGGTVVELRFQTPPDVDAVRERLQAGGYGSAQVQTFGTGSDLLVRLQPREDAGTAADAEASGGVALWIGVDQQHLLAHRGQGGAEVDRRGGLAHPALLVGDHQDPQGPFSFSGHDRAS